MQKLQNNFVMFKCNLEAFHKFFIKGKSFYQDELINDTKPFIFNSLSFLIEQSMLMTKVVA